jgi:glycosyltransferase involved in cell wall biosynthesis
MSKKKVLVLSDHALSTSGVGTQTRHLINGMINKGGWSFRQFGAAMKHTDYRTIAVNDDFIIKPIDGFGSRDLIRVTLATEKPDLLLIFTDPRFFIWLFEMADEIHQVCPIAWWHVWDNLPYPSFNEPLYQSTDLINCHSYLTYEMIKSRFPEKTNFIPHSVPPEIFFPMSQAERRNYRRMLLGSNKEDHFVGIWNNRNARRKRPSDVLESWKIFLDDMHIKSGHKKATLIMHTDPLDQEGPNLYAVADQLRISDNVVFSKERLGFDKINTLYNISDFCMNISFAEGFGLGTLEAMNAGVPIIAAKTGGLTRQVVDHRDGTENGVALNIDLKTMVGSQSVPYIYEDYVTNENVAKGIMKLYSMSDTERRNLGDKVFKYARSEFNFDATIDRWHETATSLLEKWKDNRKSYTVSEL